MSTAAQPHIEDPTGIQELPVVLGDGPGPRARIGFIALANGHVSELEVAEMAPRDEVVVYVSRVADKNAASLHDLKNIEHDLSRAASMILPEGRIDVVVYGCTSGSMVVGEDVVRQRIQAVRPGVPVTTPITGALAAFAALGAEKIVLLTPYVHQVTAAMRDYVEGRGIEVLHTASFNVGTSEDIARIEPAAIRDAAIALDRPDADALFVCCTAFRACRVIDDIEAAIGKPVVTSNQALAWHALRLAGFADPVDGFGRLMRI